ncbi:MAG: single-stranded DNA-binding protein [Candidatus Kapaibacterium sp.]|jgi:single-strand DNA-binding protein
MSRSLNKVMLIGNVGKDPDVNFTASGIPVAQFRLATTESRKDKDGQYQEHTEWHTIIAWRGLAEIIQRLVHRGSRIYVEGRLQTRIFEDQSGTKKYFTEVVADNILLLDGRRSEESSSQGESAAASIDDDIPF